ncbi:hypothetical protein GVO57_00970 [Sphingomonas changnyeongensis]|uniref:Uncharacterized protein n=1 Tax=Sphingomonas changnyeongensis TaxID=2698679 RepID=A0A7Z2S7I4_9SPHN|nr:hypothetical protein [Sphingomonas changnyeongensis]QHL89652.1 hypothetical protein GVO57_00970 [Sphingomonas changnyeongensis]
MLVAVIAVLLMAAPGPDMIVVRPDQPVAALVEDRPVALGLRTGSIDRINLNAATVARLGLKPAGLMGKVSLKIGRTRIMDGRNRPVGYAVGGRTAKGRVIWFDGLDGPHDGTIGPFAFPQARIAVELGGGGGQAHAFPLAGAIDTAGYTPVERGSAEGNPDGRWGFGLSFGVEHDYRLPLASAATGAALLAELGGTVTDEVWDEEILLGVTRPVRRVVLARPLEIGPFRLTEIAVRVRDRRDAMGAGDALPEPPRPDDDPAEIVVTGRQQGGMRPIYTLEIGRPVLAACRSITFDKAARQILLDCPPAS